MTRSSLASLTLLLLAAACGGGGDGGSTTPTRTVASISLSSEVLSLNVGATATLTATAKAADGSAISAPVSWASNDVSIARVDGAGTVTGVAAGVALVTASSGSASARAVVTVLAPITAIEVTGPSASVGVGGTLQLTATARDASGAAHPERVVTWSSSDANVATVSGSGLVSAKAIGTVTISATSDAITGRYTLTVNAVKQPSISAVAPATLVPGGTATITGSDFDVTPTANSVSIGGVAATVTAATPTQLTVRLSANYPCQATQGVPVSVTTIGGVGTGSGSLRVALSQAPVAGTLLTINDPAQYGCVELSGSGSRYLVALVNTSQTPGAQIAGLTVKGVASAGSTIASVSPTRIAASPASVALAPTLENARRLASLRTVELNKSVLARLRRQVGSPRRVIRQGAAARRALRASRGTAGALAGRGTVSGLAGTGVAALTGAPQPTRIPTVVGDTTTVRVRAADCSTYTNVLARAVYVGPKSVVLEDTKAALAGTMDADYRALGAEFDNVMFPILTQNFGDPLALDSVTNNDGRIAMLFSPIINQIDANLLGFVSACDFFPPDAAPWIGASNQAEIFYARAPTAATGSASDVNSKDGWYRYMRSTLIHESKHIASFAERILRTPETAPDLILEESWLEEGTAQVAIELYARTIYGSGLTWRGNAAYDQTLRCDWASRYLSCGSPPILMLDHFAFLQDYVANVDGKSFLSSGNADSDIYGSAWNFARWAADTYATSESNFFYTLTTDWQRAGITNIRARTGQTWDRMVTNFMTSLWATGRAGVTPAAGAQFVQPGWNLASIWAGMNADGRYPAQPLKQQSGPLGAFNFAVTRIAGSSASFVELSSATPVANQIIAVRDASGTPLAASTQLRVVVLKVQ